MINAEENALPDLETLHILLMRENMAHSSEIWLHIHQLLANRAAKGLLPQTAEEFVRLLSPVVCKSPQHQYRILAVINEWLNGQKPTVQAQLSSSEQPAAIAWRKRLSRFNRRSLYGVVFLVSLLITLLVTFYYWSPTPEAVIIERPLTDEEVISDKVVIPSPSKVQIIDQIAPNPLPMPKRLSSNWLRWQQLSGWIIPSIPAFIALLWLLWHYRKRTVLRNNAPQGEKLLKHITFNLSKDNVVAPFSGAEFAKAAAKLLHPVWVDSRRLHIADSVIATSKNSGYFTPRYQQRHVRPEYLILVQSVHGDDQNAAYAELLVTALQQQNVDVRSYRFRDDPRRLFPRIQPAHGADTATLSLKKLAQKYTDARMIVISDWNILFQPYYPDRHHDWVKEFDGWLKRVWLSPGYEDAQWAKRAAGQAQQLNFRLLPMASNSIEKVAQWLRMEGEPPAPLGETGEDVEHLPTILTETADSWLNWQPPHGLDLKRLCQKLNFFLGDDGFLLLQALAVFPKPLSPLPQILDIQLNTMTASPSRTGSHQDSERRLQRISRLPWLRFAYMPDYLRLCLLKGLNRSDRKKIRLAWTAILQGLAEEEKPDKISVPISLPKTGKLKIKHLLASQAKNSAINDSIFDSSVPL